MLKSNFLSIRTGGDGTHFTSGTVAMIRLSLATFAFLITVAMSLPMAKAGAGQGPVMEWIQIPTDPANTPVGREFSAMVYDERWEVVVMHGGRATPEGARSPSDFLSDTWQWNGKEWSLVSTSGPQTYGHGMAYDAARGVTVLYGGRDPASFIGGGNEKINLGDTWEWDGESWTKIDTGQGVPITTPLMAYDPTRGRVIRHGGVSDGQTFDQDTTWEWDGRTWTQIAEGPTRAAGGMIYDSNRRKMVMFGGGRTINEFPDDTWELDGNLWTPISTEPSAGRIFMAMVFDTSRKVGVRYGGITSPASIFGDTWEWDGIQWSSVSVPHSPGVRTFHAMAYDSKRRKVVLFGGNSCVHCPPFLNDIWEYGLAEEAAFVDFNGDGIVDCADICMMTEHWHTDEPAYDVVPDGIIDAQDLGVLAEYLFTYPGAVAYWKLDETEGGTAHDSAAANDGVVIGDAIWQPDGGMVDGALQLDGIDDYVSASFVLNPADGAFSIFAWVKGGSPGQAIISQTDGFNWLCADASEGNLMTELRHVSRGGSGAPLVSQTPITDDVWHRVGLSWDGTNRSLYVDDVEVASDTQPSFVSLGGGLYIGTDKNKEPGTFWSGLIDDVRIYDRAVVP
jgi:hypothetical protein